MAFVHGPLMPLGASGQHKLNFLWRADNRPVYAMDNHLGALWCWLRELKPTEPYSLIHIDFHWDDVPADPSSLEQLRAVDGQDIGAMLALRTELPGNSLPSVRFDNYMQVVNTLRPELREAILIAHDECFNTAFPWKSAYYETRSHGALQEVEYLARKAEGKLLINLDIDFFFLSLAGAFTDKHTQAYADNFISELVTRLHLASPDAIWTIAWSPEFCGGWSKAASVFREISKALGVTFPFEALGL